MATTVYVFNGIDAYPYCVVPPILAIAAAT